MDKSAGLQIWSDNLRQQIDVETNNYLIDKELYYQSAIRNFENWLEKRNGRTSHEELTLAYENFEKYKRNIRKEVLCFFKSKKIFLQLRDGHIEDLFNYLKDLPDLNRELGIKGSFQPIFQSKKIIKSFYDNCHNLKKFVAESKNWDYDLFFSKDDKYIGSGFSAWILKDDFFLKDSNEILRNPSTCSLPYNFFYIKSFNVDSSKIFGSLFTISGSWIAVKDISRKEDIQKIDINCTRSLISNCPSNPDLFSYSTQETIKLKDLRSQDAQEIKCNAEIISFQYNPVKDYLLLVNSKSKNGFHVVDLRNFKPTITYLELYTNNNIEYSAVYNKSGSEIVFRKTGSNPLLYKSDEIYPTHEFDAFGHFDFLRTSNKRKTVCFAGPNDEYIVATSDNYKGYIWEIPRKNNFNVEDEKTTRKVNKTKFVLSDCILGSSALAYNYQRSILGCSGMYEKGIAFWSPFEFDNKKSYKKKSFSCRSKTIYDYIEEMFPSFFHALSFENVESNFLTKNYSFEDEDLENTLEEDMNLIYIRSFINDYNTSEVFKDLHLISSLKKILNKQINFKTRFYQDDYLSVFFQTYKVFLRKSLIEKSILYVKNKASSLEKSLKRKSVLDEAHSKPAYSKKIKIIEETIISLNLMSNSLSKILEKNEILYNDPKVTLKKLIQLFANCPKCEDSFLLEYSDFKNWFN